jgi:drug/metabolite transporter (DMT)-like permease
MVGILMMTEAVFGPFWAWMFLEETPKFIVLIGGSIIIIAVLIQFWSLLKNAKKT